MGVNIIGIIKIMKESKLIKMQYDLKLTQQALVVALNRIEQLEKKEEDDNRRKDKEDTGVQNLVDKKEG